MSRLGILLCGLLVVCFGWRSLAQHMPYRYCYTPAYMDELRTLYPERYAIERFESWLQRQFSQQNPLQQRNSTYADEYRIPVVVHIIHWGEPPGSGHNIPYAQVLSQLRVLNEDFQRKNADSLNTPELFSSLAGRIHIRFEPATRTPEGLPMVQEPGVNRIDALEMGWGATAYTTAFIENIIKPSTQWNPEEYLNIWVCPIAGNILGYAQFPESADLAGLPTGGQPANRDGVVVHVRAFGSNYDASGNPLSNPFNLFAGLDRGRTATHEVGHFLGLRHVWGDGDCSVDDFVEDTPLASQPNYVNLPCTFPAGNSCHEGEGDLPDMFQNYMDYSYDACMNLFTIGQVARMEVVLTHSPRRKELLLSTAADPLPIYASFIASKLKGCAPLAVEFIDISGVAEGEPNIQTWNWQFDVQNVGGVVYPSVSSDLQSPGTVLFDPRALGAGTYEYVVQLNVSNGERQSSFQRTISVVVPEADASLPQLESFDDWHLYAIGVGPRGWQASTNMMDGNIPLGWQSTNRASWDGSQCIYVPNYEYDLRAGQIDLRSPFFSLEDYVAPQLRFYVAYAPYADNFFDGLEVWLLRDCGAEALLIYQKSGADLATASATTQEFVPTFEQWREEVIDLSAYVHEANLQLLFRNVGGYGNHLYLDRIKIFDAILVADFNFLAEDTPGTLPFALWLADASRVDTSVTTPISTWLWETLVHDPLGVLEAQPAIMNEPGPHRVQYRILATEAGRYPIQVRLTVSNGQLSDEQIRQYELLLPLNPPVDLQAIPSNQRKVELHWQYPNDNGAEGFYVERAEANLDFSIVGNLPASERSFTDPTVDLDKTYFYRVYAYNQSQRLVSEPTPAVELRTTSVLTPITADTAIEEYIQLYPNPNRGSFVLEVAAHLRGGVYILTDLLGRELYRGRLSSEKQYIALPLPKGVYSLRIEVEPNKSYVRRLVIW